MGASVYDANGQTATAVAKPQVHQGALERSNVEPVLEISHMIDVMRAYQATTTLAQSEDQLKLQAIDKLGSTPN